MLLHTSGNRNLEPFDNFPKDTWARGRTRPEKHQRLGFCVLHSYRPSVTVGHGPIFEYFPKHYLKKNKNILLISRTCFHSDASLLYVSHQWERSREPGAPHNAENGEEHSGGVDGILPLAFLLSLCLVLVLVLWFLFVSRCLSFSKRVCGTSNR